MLFCGSDKPIDNCYLYCKASREKIDECRKIKPQWKYQWNICYNSMQEWAGEMYEKDKSCFTHMEKIKEMSCPRYFIEYIGIGL